MGRVNYKITISNELKLTFLKLISKSEKHSFIVFGLSIQEEIINSMK